MHAKGAGVVEATAFVSLAARHPNARLVSLNSTQLLPTSSLSLLCPCSVNLTTRLIIVIHHQGLDRTLAQLAPSSAVCPSSR